MTDDPTAPVSAPAPSPAPTPISTALAADRIAVKFTAPDGTPAFAVHWQDGVYAYINQCPHAGGPLDFEGQIIESSGRFLMCARHGAIFEPDTGRCVGGPCKGASLVPVAVHERPDGSIWQGQAE